jgi:hypothetical protein
MAGALLTAVVLGLLGGLLPAVSATRSDAVQAMRGG